MLLDASDGTDTWGSIGVSENIIEASWEALVDSLEAGMLPARRTRRAATPRLVIPLAQPLVGPREEELVLETLRSAAAWRSGRGWASSRQRSSGRLGVDRVSRRVQRHRRPAPGDPRGGGGGAATRW